MKILVISHNSFSKIYNNGKTLSAIFSAFDKKDLCQLYFTPLGEPDEDRCGEYFLISDKDAFRSILYRKKCGGVPIKTSQSYLCPTSRKTVKQTSFKLAVRSIMWKFSAWYKGGLNRWLKEQRPDLIFFVGGNSVFSHCIAVSLSQRLNIPLVTYFTDDYVINPPTDFYLAWLKRIYSVTINQSRKLFAIGRQMAYDYSVLYKKDFEPIMNIVDIPETLPCKKKYHDDFVIGYFGGLHLGRADEICRFACFIEENLPLYLKNKIKIKVYSFATLSSESNSLFNKFSIIKENGVSGDKLKEAMDNVDIFLHVESSKPEYHYITKLSVSTKIPEYMSFAKPIIAFGPADVASFRVIAEVNPDLVFDDNIKTKTNIQVLEKLIGNSELIAEYGLKNYNFAKSNYDKGKVAKLFKQSMDSILKNDVLP